MKPATSSLALGRGQLRLSTAAAAKYRILPLLLRTSNRHSNTTCSWQRAFSITRPFRQVDNKKAGEDGARDSFKAQLYESTAHRLQREQEERARLSDRMRAGEGGAGLGANRTSAGGRAATLLFVTLSAVGIGYWAGTQTAPPEETLSTLPLAELRPIKHNVSESNLQAAWVDLRDIVDANNISTDLGQRESRAGSAWSSHDTLPSQVPFAVVQPASTEQVSQIMRVCHARRIPVTAYSGGTSLEGHFAATRGGICIDFSRMDKILKLNKEDLDVIVQPAVGWEHLNAELAKSNLFFPPDPGPGAMIGGMVGTGCSGTNAYRYGTMKDWVINLTVVLADGTIIKTRQRPRKSSAGYDLTRMFVGSEGTLGLVTEATLKLTPKPLNISVAVSTFPTIRDAANCVFQVVNAGLQVAAVELLDDVQMKCLNDADMTVRKWKEEPTVLFKFSGTPSGVKEQIGIVHGFAKSTGSKSFDFAKSAAEVDELWEARKEALWSVVAKKQNEDDRIWTTDVAVPISQLPLIIEETKDDIAKSGITGSIVGHVGDGNFHAIIAYNRAQHDTVEAIVHRMVKRAIELEGTATGEHGVGLIKRDYLPHELGETTVDAMRRLKHAFDPLCLLNCDKIVRSERPKPGEIGEW